MRSNPNNVSLLLFSRTPQSKQAKSRLRANLEQGDHLVTQLHYELVLNALQLGLKNFNSLYCAWHPEFAATSIETLSVNQAALVNFSQRGQDFGERLQNAINDVIKWENGGLLIIGSDCPLLTSDSLQLAAMLIANGSLVIGPDNKDGFYLLGIPSGKNAIDCSSWFSGAHNQVDALVSYFGDMPFTLLPELCDFDELSDLRQCIDHPCLPTHINSIVKRILSEAISNET